MSGMSLNMWLNLLFYTHQLGHVKATTPGPQGISATPIHRCFITIYICIKDILDKIIFGYLCQIMRHHNTGPYTQSQHLSGIHPGVVQATFR